MRYFLDVEFNAYKGGLISLALIREDLESLYLVFPRPTYSTPWVSENVMPYIDSVPEFVKINRIYLQDAARFLEKFFHDDEDIEIVVDWPDDIKYLSELLITSPGCMIKIPRIRFTMERVDAWPLKHKPVDGWGVPIQHNAWWDAWALSDLFFWKAQNENSAK